MFSIKKQTFFFRVLTLKKIKNSCVFGQCKKIIFVAFIFRLNKFIIKSIKNLAKIKWFIEHTYLTKKNLLFENKK
jgi:hypothetical protein